MKINITFDLTPEEFRKAMGLPDVEPMQQEFFRQMMEKMQNGEEGFDAMGMYQAMLQGGMASMNQIQQMFFQAMSSEKK